MPEILLGNIKGPKGDQGNEGPRGPQGVQGEAGKDGAGVPDGGSEGQVLAKSGSDNQQTTWIDIYNKSQMDAKIQTINESINNTNTSIETLKTVREITLGTTWSSNSQTVAVEGVKATDSPILEVKMTGDINNKKKLQAEWSKIVDAVTSEGSITFYASENTTTSLTVLVKGV